MATKINDDGTSMTVPWEWNTVEQNIPIKFIKDLRNNLFQTLKEYPGELAPIKDIFGFFDEALVRTLLED